ncbi:MAG: hypothetical protein FJ206_08240 [Gemmatimonadetes bacterium]|nr:hypothetical protein [Gemmatimonadota bacterium]
MNRRQRQRRARITRVLALAPIVVLALGVLVGFWLPPVYQTTMVQRLPTSPDAIFAVLTDLDAMPTWRRDVVSLERLPEAGGIVRWQERDRRGRWTPLARTAALPGRIEVEVATSRLTPRRWIYQWRAVDGQTELSVVEATTIENPLERPLVRLFGGRRDYLARWVADIETRLNGRRQRLAAES